MFTEEGQFVRRIGCENITNFPNGIDISGELGQLMPLLITVCPMTVT